MAELDLVPVVRDESLRDDGRVYLFVYLGHVFDAVVDGCVGGINHVLDLRGQLFESVTLYQIGVVLGDAKDERGNEIEVSEKLSFHICGLAQVI